MSNAEQPAAVLPLFRPGTQVMYHGKPETVDHIIIQRYDLLVHLKEANISVNADKVELEPTRIPLSRTH
ncbi:hypothetical protein DW355_13490 [Hylemonella gracilis]|uniref:Uncharacterized protein n=1 Tax=Hylemonella gracilis TaxID=80880 RepID=A0A4P6UMZ7_9BURK|nr:hypothetical protein [Hylemonella gracilis]QBK05610.1 hypothetical protein DW355_13490 [Hylemonella gracilis]